MSGEHQPAPAERTQSRPGAVASNTADPIEAPTLSFVGDFPAQVTVIQRALCTLLMNMGHLDAEQRHVLVPYIEMKFGGIRQGTLEPANVEDQAADELFSRVLTLENALWLLADMAADIRHACQDFRSVCLAPEILELTRITEARDYAERLRQEAELTVTVLDKLVSRPAERVAAEPEQRAGRPAPRKFRQRGSR